MGFSPPPPLQGTAMNRLLSCSVCCAAVLLGLSACAPMTPASPAMKTIAVAGAPKAIGPYAQGIVAGGMLYTAGQTARDPVSNKLVEGDIVVQTDQIFTNLQAVLAGGGCTLADVVKVTVFMTDLGDFTKMNEAFAKRMGTATPARSTVQVAKLPGGAQIEIDMVARVP